MMTKWEGANNEMEEEEDSGESSIQKPVTNHSQPLFSFSVNSAKLRAKREERKKQRESKFSSQSSILCFLFAAWFVRTYAVIS